MLSALLNAEAWTTQLKTVTGATEYNADVGTVCVRSVLRSVVTTGKGVRQRDTQDTGRATQSRAKQGRADPV